MPGRPGTLQGRAGVKGFLIENIIKLYCRTIRVAAGSSRETQLYSRQSPLRAAPLSTIKIALLVPRYLRQTPLRRGATLDK